MKLIGSLASPFARKVRIVLAEKKIDYDFQVDNPWNESAELRTHNPLSQVPVLVLEDGTTLFDSRVIVEFLDNVSPLLRLIPSANRERSEVRRWEAVADGILDAGVLVRMERQRPEKLRSKDWVDRQLRKIDAGLDMMDKELAGNAWCAGSGYSLADIAVGACLGWLDFRFADLGWRTRCPNLVRHAAKLAERPSFADTTPREA
jgi:glutathione S-transferase